MPEHSRHKAKLLNLLRRDNAQSWEVQKRDFCKIEKVVNYWGTTFGSVLEKTEHYFENSENIKIEKFNKRVYIDYDYESKFLKILFK